MTEVLHAAHSGRPSSTGRRKDWTDSLSGPNYHQYRPHQSWTPSINLYESGDGYCVVVDLAGVRADSIDIRVENEQMVISGHRPAPEMSDVCDQLCLHLMEIEYGQFVRALDIPGGVDVEHIEACYRSGYLWVRLPKV